MKGATLVLISGIAVTLAGCCSFHKDWDQVATAASTADDGGGRSRSGSGVGSMESRLEGRWEGQWKSDKNQHHGALRCIITRLADDEFSARFHAKYRRLLNLSFSYTARIGARPVGNTMEFNGEAHLGWYAGGIYRYQGNVATTNFFSTYSCKYDYGTFSLTRVPP